MKNIISDEMKEILDKTSTGEDVTTIFDAIINANIDWRSIHPEDVKPVLVEAILASKSA